MNKEDTDVHHNSVLNLCILLNRSLYDIQLAKLVRFRAVDLSARDHKDDVSLLHNMKGRKEYNSSLDITQDTSYVTARAK